MLSWNFCKTVFDTITGLVLVDSSGKILYINKHDAALLGIAVEEAIGKPVQEVIPDTKIHQTVADRQAVIADLSYFNGLPYYSTRFPLYQDDHFIGVVDYDIFDDKAAVQTFLAKINALTSELNFYKNEVRRLHRHKYSIDNILGESAAARNIRQEIETAAENTFTVLITGETGTGKELAAHAIHALSHRSGSFISLNCSAIPAELFEAELFGYEDGAFTNARKGGKKGKFELADGGTLFLDEIDQLPLAMQPKLLRAIQEREIDRVGGKFPVSVDIRIICAANQNLQLMMEKGLFREDLFYRLNVVPIQLPPLRQRIEDIPLLVEHLASVLNDRLGRRIVEIDPGFIEALVQYDWPGNIRELQNIVERAIIAATPDCTRLTRQHLHNISGGSSNNVFCFATGAMATEPLVGTKNNQISHPDRDANAAAIPPNLLSKDSSKVLNLSLEEIKINAEKEAITATLAACSGNKSQTAKLLQISRALLYQKLRKYQLSTLTSSRSENEGGTDAT
jgi:transcriptional regulator with PAS, ATPase and Fis domain